MDTPRPSRLPKGQRVYAVGDIHGRADLLEKMLRLIEADHLGFRGESHVVLLGDYMDRGPHSRDVLDILSKGTWGTRRLECVRGNHEDIVLRLFRDHSVAPGWFHYGGLQTLRSYGIPVVDATQDFDDIFSLRSRLEKAMPDAHKAFLESLPHKLRYGDYAFVHAGVHPGRSWEDQDPHHFLWMREPFLSSTADLGYTVVHGHSIRLKPNSASAASA